MAVPPPELTVRLIPSERGTAPVMTFFDKQTIRREARAARDAFVATNPIALSPPVAITDRFAPGVTVATYFPIASEADPAPLVAAARAAGATLALAHVEARSAPMRFLEWREGDVLITGPCGVGKSWLAFCKVVDSQNEKNAVNKIYSLLGSEHGLKRDQIKIDEVKTVE